MPETLTTPEQPDFQASIGAITRRRLTPENLERYADDALNDLVGVVDEVVQNYKRQPTVTGHTPREDEQSAFAYYGLEADAIEATLDHIAEKAEDIHGLDAVIAKITKHTDAIITPPNKPGDALVAGSGSYGENQYVPRLKTLLFILANKFSVDLTKPDECTVLVGKVNEYMMRNEPYQLVSLPTLNRDVLICDEEGNATFVFDRAELEQSGISQDTLITMDKDELWAFLNQHPNAGRRLPHSKYFTEKLTSLLEVIPNQGEDIVVSADSARFLELKEVSDDFKTRNATAKELDISHDAVKKAADALGDELGYVTMAKFKNGPAPVYSSEQRARIKQWLDEQGFLVPRLPEDYRTIGSLPREFSVSFYTVQKAIEELGDELGDGMRVRVVGNYTDAFSPEQQKMIRNQLVRSGILVEGEHEGYLSRKALAKELGTSEQSVTQAINDSLDELGETRKIKVGPRVADGYSPGQQQVIRAYLEGRGIVGHAAPEGFFTKRQFAEVCGYSSHAVDKAIQTLGEGLGDALIAKVGTTNARPLHVYSPDQQASIIEWMRTNGFKPTKTAIGSVATSKAVEADFDSTSS